MQQADRIRPTRHRHSDPLSGRKHSVALDRGRDALDQAVQRSHCTAGISWFLQLAHVLAHHTTNKGGNTMSRVLVLLFAAVSAFAQSQAINGSIRGRVTDAAGAAVPAAKVTVLNDQTGFTRALSTDDD